jgi:CRP-like cAMP-binding protein
MSDILSAFGGQPVRKFSAGETVMEQGHSTGLLFILIEGQVEVFKDGFTVAASSEPGAFFGDLAVLLRAPHTATVRAVRDSSFYVVNDPRAFLERNPAVTLHLCGLLARRLDALNKYLVDVRQQFAGHDHIGMVDNMLDTLMHRQPRARVAPKPSTLRDPELAD